MIGDWQSSIAKADASDWLTVAAYACAALLSASAARHAKLSDQLRERSFWCAAAVLLVFLAVNELLDLQTLLTSLGRAHAKANGWYGEHRRVQYLFVMALGVAGVLAGAAMLWVTKRMHCSVRLGIAGLGFIGLFILLRAASIHHLDVFLGRGAPEFNWGSLQEVLGIFMIAVGAALYVRKRENER